MTTPIYVFNKYYTLYHNIISLAISKNRYKSKETYYENHHIIPKSFNGSNEPDNLVLLTAREHYICHYLLTKFTTSDHKRKMTFAFNRMNTDKNHTINSKLFQVNRILLSTYLKTRKHSYETKQKIKLSCVGINTKPKTEDHKRKLASSHKGKKLTKEHCVKISNANKGKSNHKFKGYYITPWGKFETSKLASTSLISYGHIRNICNNPHHIINNCNIAKSKYLQSLPTSPLGKSYNDLGFAFQSII